MPELPHPHGTGTILCSTAQAGYLRRARQVVWLGERQHPTLGFAGWNNEVRKVSLAKPAYFISNMVACR